MRGHLWSGLGSDLRFALRSLRPRRGISQAVVTTLTLGIGATALGIGSSVRSSHRPSL